MWQRKLLLLTLAATMLHIADARSADSKATQTTADLRCIAAMMIWGANEKDRTKLADLRLFMLYYIGRVDGREPKIDLENRLITEGKGIKAGDIHSVADKCAEDVRARVASMRVSKGD